MEPLDMIKESVFCQKMMLPFSAMGPNNHVRIDRILGLFQDAAGLHGHELGISGFDLAEKNLKWVISRYQIRVHHALGWPHSVELRTWRHPWKNLYELRRFAIVDADGTLQISALGIWVMVKAANSKPVRLSPHMPPRLMEQTAPAPDLWSHGPEPPAWNHQKRFHIRMHDLDLNQHVNNTVYVAWALEALPKSWLCRRIPQSLMISFLKEAFYPDAVVSKAAVAELSDTIKTVHAIFHETSGEKLAVLTLTWKKNFHGAV